MTRERMLAVIALILAILWLVLGHGFLIGLAVIVLALAWIV